MKKVKILATIGPASRSYDMLVQLAREGVDVFRINFSHEKHDTAVQLIADIRKAEQEVGRPLAIMGDLCGPKIRIGDVEPGTMLAAGDKIEVYEAEVTGNKERFSLNYPSIVRDLKPGAEIYVDDGKLKLRVEEPTENGVMAVVTVGGELKARKGFYGQGVSIDLNGLSEKDEADLKFLLTQNIDAIAVSFVQYARDIEYVKAMLPKENAPLIVTKLETYKGVHDNLDEIIEATDVMMLARGDMGLAVPMEEVPHLQKRIIHKCIQKAKPVITATQMLESMTTNSLPTRAEVTDVANAILDGTDAVMLSAETASGNFPVEVVKMMARIIRRAESTVEPIDYREENTIPNAISSSIGRVADQLGAKIVVAFTEHGITARRISRHRHQQIILALSPKELTVRQLNFSWGVYASQIDTTESFDDMMQQAKEYARNNTIMPLESGETFVISAGLPFGKSGTTNLILVEKA